MQVSKTHTKEDIPEGVYCYTLNESTVTMFPKREVCPFWSLSKHHPEQLNGYCSYLEVGDWTDGHLSLLWDQVKECDVKYELPSLEECIQFEGLSEGRED